MKQRCYQRILVCAFLLLMNHRTDPISVPSQQTIKSFANTILKPLAYTPLLLMAARGIETTRQNLGFVPSMLIGNVATLGYLCWQQEQLKRRQALPVPQEQATRLATFTITNQTTSTEKFHDVLQQCLDDEGIHGIILKIDAESGRLSICETLFRELKRAAEQKPIVAVIEKSCCREPYLIATAAQIIIANEQATVGMIGTGNFYAEQRSDPAQEIFYFYAGKHTPLGDVHHHITAQEQRIIIDQLELQYQQMCSTIAQQRHLDLGSIATWAEGKPFLGRQAHALNLIDRVGTMSDAYEAMAELLISKQATEPRPTKFKLVPYAI